MRLHLHINALAGKLELGTLEREALDCVQKLQDTRDGERELVENPDFKLLESGGRGRRSDEQVLPSKFQYLGTRKREG